MASGQLSVVPPYVEPRRRSLPVAVTTTVRWICFLTLLAAFVLALPLQHPGSRQLADLTSDIQSGRAAAIAIRVTSGGQTVGQATTTVRWKTSQFRWYEAKPNLSRRELEGTLALAGERSGRPVTVGTFSTRQIIFFDLSAPGVWPPLIVAAGILWVAAFLGMLTRGGHPYATRWAWFWLFVIGGVGPLLLLWKEPAPLRLRSWRRNDEYRWTQAPITGGTGFIYAIAWAVLITGAGAGISWLGSR